MSFYKDVPLVQTSGDTYYPRTTEDSVWGADGERLDNKLNAYKNSIQNMEKLQTAGGTSTAITLTGVKLEKGFTITFIVKTNNNGNTTTINGKYLYKHGTTTSPKLVAGKAVTIWYNGTHFFIKASAEGDAIADNVLAGKTFSNDDDTGLVGTMPDYTSQVSDNQSVTKVVDVSNFSGSGVSFYGTLTIPSPFNGKVDKTTTIRQNVYGLHPSVVKHGQYIGNNTDGVVGEFTGDATAVAGNLLSGKTAYVKGAKITGSIPSQGAQTITPGTSNQTIASGRYLSGTQTIKGDADLVSANILSGKEIFGVMGSAPRVVWGVAQGDEYPAEHSFRDASNTEVIKAPGVGVSGLPFAPEIIIITTDYDAGNGLYQGGNYITVWKKKRSNVSGTVPTIAYTAKQYNPNGAALYTNDVVADSNDAYVNASSFFLPIPTYGEVRWMAISTGQDEL